MAMPAATAPIPKCEQAIADALLSLEACRRFLLPGNPARDAATIANAGLKIKPGMFPNTNSDQESFLNFGLERPFITVWATQHNGTRSGTFNSTFDYVISVHAQASVDQAIVDTPAVDPLKDDELTRWFANVSGEMWDDLRYHDGIDVAGYRGGLPFYVNRGQTAEAGSFFYGTALFQLGVRG